MSGQSCAQTVRIVGMVSKSCVGGLRAVARGAFPVVVVPPGRVLALIAIVRKSDRDGGSRVCHRSRHVRDRWPARGRP